jgi:hypothetical protein
LSISGFIVSASKKAPWPVPWLWMELPATEVMNQ